MSTETGLLLGDTSWNVGLRLAETFEVRSVETLPFGLAFYADEARLDVNQALAASGYVGTLPLSNLTNAALAFWGSEGRVYVTTAGSGTSLVSAEGLFGGLTGRIPSLQAGSGISVSTQNDVVVLTATAQAPDLCGYVPFSTYTPFATDVLENAVFRRGSATTRLTLLSRDVQLVDTTTTDLRVGNSFAVVRGNVQLGETPELGITMLSVEPTETRAKTFVAAMGSQQTRLTSTGLAGGSQLSFVLSSDESMILSQGSLTCPPIQCTNDLNTVYLHPQWLDCSDTFDFSVNEATIARMTAAGFSVTTLFVEDSSPATQPVTLSPTVLRTPQVFTFHYMGVAPINRLVIHSDKVEISVMTWAQSLSTDSGTFRVKK